LAYDDGLFVPHVTFDGQFPEQFDPQSALQ
jgi:hypothetical protein